MSAGLALDDPPIVPVGAPPPIGSDAALMSGGFPVSPRPGEIEPGNIDLTNRPRVRNADGSVSTIRSLGVNIDGKETLIPTVSEDGRIMSDDEAVEQFRKTGRHLGKFDSVDASNAAAQALHEQQADQGEKWGRPAPVVPGSVPPATPSEAAKRVAEKTTALGEEQTANATERANLEKQQAEALNTFKGEHAKALQDVLNRQETHRQAAQTAVADARAKAETEPYHTYWESRSVGQNIATSLGLILGGISWNAGHVNRGVQMLEDNMNRDATLQREKHAELWKAVESAEKGERDLDGNQLRELSAFNASQGAKWDAVSGRLNAMIVANKGKGDVAQAKKTALEAQEKANTFWDNAERSAATANHLENEDAVAKERAASYAKIAESKRKKGGGGGAGRTALEGASLELKDKIGELQRSGLTGIDLDKAFDREAVRLKIPLVGKPNSINARQIKADLDKEAGAATKAGNAEVKLTEAEEARVVRDTKGKPIGLAPKANNVAKIASDIAAQEKYTKLINELAGDVEKNGRILDSADHPMTEKGRHRMSIFAEVQALGRVLAQLQATDSGTKLEHQMIGAAGVGLNPLTSILSPTVLRELGAKNSEQVRGRLNAQLGPLPKRLENAGGGVMNAGPKLKLVDMGNGVIAKFDAETGKRVP